MELKGIMDVFSALLTPLIAIVATYIAYQQYKVNQSRLNQELYVRRLVVFKAVLNYISSIGKPDFQKVTQFYADTGEADFLFKDDIPEQIEKLYKKGLELAELHEKLYPSDGSPGLSIGKERSKVAKQQSEAIKWFFDELPNTKRLFKRYLRVT